MHYSKHQFHLGGEITANSIGESCGAPTITVTVEIPHRVEWTQGQQDDFEALFEKVRELLRFEQDR